MKAIYTANQILTSISEVSKFFGLDINKITNVDRTDFYDALLGNFRAYECSLYEVTFNYRTL